MRLLPCFPFITQNREAGEVLRRLTLRKQALRKKFSFARSPELFKRSGLIQGDQIKRKKFLLACSMKGAAEPLPPDFLDD